MVFNLGNWVVPNWRNLAFGHALQFAYAIDASVSDTKPTPTA